MDHHVEIELPRPAFIDEAIEIIPGVNDDDNNDIGQRYQYSDEIIPIDFIPGENYTEISIQLKLIQVRQNINTLETYKFKIERDIEFIERHPGYLIKLYDDLRSYRYIETASYN